ncbi:MAG: hypothetical protein ACOVP7_10085 [Lacibacter sp.]
MYLLPVATTVLSFVFFAILIKDFLRRTHTSYMFWFAAGMAAYGAGAFAESIHSLSGFNAFNFKLWYISGALAGGWALVTGLLYLILKKKTADILMLIGAAYILVAAVYTFLSPVSIIPDGERLNGSAFEWEFIRPMTRVVHLYSFVLLTGAAFFSAFQYSKSSKFKTRFLGILIITIGGLLPGFGKSHSNMDINTMFYVTELAGLLLIFAGSLVLKNDNEAVVKSYHANINS